MNLGRIIGFSIFQAFVSTLIATLFGFSAAYYVAKKKSLFARLLVLFSAVPLSVPPLLVALGYVLFFGNNGSFNQLLVKVFSLNSAPVSILYSFTGIIIAHGFYNFPIIMKAVSDIWLRLPEEEEWTAKLLGASRFRLFWQISFPHLLPTLISAASIVFLFCFFSFIIVLLFGPVGLSTLEVEVYRASRLSFNFFHAGVLAFIETLIALTIVWLYSFFEKKALATRGQSRMFREKEKNQGFSLVFSIFLFLCIALFFLFPLFAIPYKAFSTKNAFLFLFSQKTFFLSLRSSFFSAFMSALLASFFAFFYALFIRLKDPEKSQWFYRFLPYIPMAISSVVLGFIITSILYTFRIRANLFILSLCQAFLFWPFAFRQIQSAFDKIPVVLDEASVLLSPSLWFRLRYLYLPLTRSGLFSALSFSFAMSLGDASLPLILAIPNVQTLSLFIYRLAGTYRFTEACAAGTIVLGLSVIVFYLGEQAKRGTNK